MPPMPAPSRHERHPLRTRIATWVLGAAMVALLAISALRWWQGGVSRWAVAAAMAVPSALLASVLIIALAWWLTRGHTALVLTLAAALLWGSCASLATYFAPNSQAQHSHTLRVATLNTNTGEAQIPSVVALAQRVDLLTLQELQPEQVATYSAALGPSWRLISQGTDEARQLRVAMWARVSAQPSHDQRLGGPAQPAARADLNPSGAAIRLIGLRLVNPWFQSPEIWQGGFEMLTEQAQEARAAHLPLVVLGDLNSAPSAVAYSRFLSRSGLRDCAALTGRGWMGTWNAPPNAPLAPVLIDHVLVSEQVSCSTLNTERIPGSDHRALLATISW